jgi:hypothetical protein
MKKGVGGLKTTEGSGRSPTVGNISRKNPHTNRWGLIHAYQLISQNPIGS